MNDATPLLLRQTNIKPNSVLYLKSVKMQNAYISFQSMNIRAKSGWIKLTLLETIIIKKLSIFVLIKVRNLRSKRTLENIKSPCEKQCCFAARNGYLAYEGVAG